MARPIVRPIEWLEADRRVVWVAMLAPVLLLPLAYAWCWPAVDLGAAVWAELQPPWFPIKLVVLALLHELLHGLAFVIVGGAHPRDVSFAVDWRQLQPATFCHRLISARAARIAALAPLLLLGLLPGALALALGDAVLLVWGTAMSSAAAGDVATVVAMRAVPAHAPMWFSQRPPPSPGALRSNA